MRSFRTVAAALVLSAGTFLQGSAAFAVTEAKHVFPTGMKIHTILGQNVDSRKLDVGTNFILRVDEPTIPALDKAEIVGHVTDVAGPGGLDRARIGFVLDYIKFSDGVKVPIKAEVVNANVTNFDSARKEAARFNLPVPQGQVTPGPIAFQITFGAGSSPSITPPPPGLSGGYVYATSSGENIVVPAGTPATLRLTGPLTIE